MRPRRRRDARRRNRALVHRPRPRHQWARDAAAQGAGARRGSQASSMPALSMTGRTTAVTLYSWSSLAASPPSICRAGGAHRRNTYIALLGGSMLRARLGRLAADVLMVAMLALAAATGAAAQEAADLAALNTQVDQLNGQGKYQEAAAIAEKALAVAERVLGKEHPDTLTSVNNLAALYQAQGRYGEAEPLYRRALEASERVLGNGASRYASKREQSGGAVSGPGPLCARPSRSTGARSRPESGCSATEHPDTLRKREQSGGAVFRAARLDPRRAILAAQHRRDRRAHAARRAGTGQAVIGKEKKRSGANRAGSSGILSRRYTVSRRKAARPMRQPRARCF